MSDAIESCGCESEPHQCVEADPAITMLQADLAARDAEIARLTAELAQVRTDKEALVKMFNENPSALWSRLRAAEAELAAARAVPPDVEAAVLTDEQCETIEHAADMIDVECVLDMHQSGVPDDSREPHRAAHREVSRALRAILDATASQPATVGGLLATHLKAIRSRDVVIECFDGDLFAQVSYEESVIDELRGGEHHQTVSNYYAERTFDGGWSDADPIFDIDVLADRLNYCARLVPADLADADPATRGPIVEVP